MLNEGEREMAASTTAADETTLVFVVPVYNEADNVPRLLTDFETPAGAVRRGAAG